MNEPLDETGEKRGRGSPTAAGAPGAAATSEAPGAAATSEAPGTAAGRPIEDASTLPASWYYDGAHHAREMDIVFARTWQHVARTGQLRRVGDHVTADLAGEPILVVRGADGIVRALSNVCRHRAGVVVRGEGCAKAFSCSYHGWTYSLDGTLLAAPEMEGVRGFDMRAFGLPPFRCESWGPFVFVNLDPRARPLIDELGALPRLAGPFALESIPFARRVNYEIACNWKVYVDNYMEGYHVPKAHPGLNAVIDYKHYEVRTEGPVVTQTAPARSAGAEPGKAVANALLTARGSAARASHDRQARTVRPGKTARASVGRPNPAGLAGGGSAGAGETGIVEGAGSLYLWLYPNFMLNINPGYTQTNMILPLGPEKTLCVFDYYFHDSAGRGASKRAREKSIAWADEIQREDIWICESVQKNLRSRTYTAGRYSAKRENGLYHFHELLRRALVSQGPA